MPHEVIMPALGMAQDSGVIVVWRRSVGDRVAVGDVLMEVETDKAVMEVEAQAEGYLTECRAEAGVDVPVGEVVAILAESPDERPAEAPPPPRAKAPAAAEPETPPHRETRTPVAAPTPPPPAAEPSPTGPAGPAGRVLASPKARRLARERGIDLATLAAAGQRQPIHAADLDTLAGGGLSASVPAAAFDSLRAWLAPADGPPSARILAAFASGAWRQASGAETVTLRVDTRPGDPGLIFRDPDRVGLGQLRPTDSPPPGPPDLRVLDLSAPGPDPAPEAYPAPCARVQRDGAQLLVSLVLPAGTPGQDRLGDCLGDLAGRLEEPLRHLL